MTLSMPVEDLCGYYSRQLNNLFPDKTTITDSDVKRIIDTALDRLHFCFKHVAYKRYNDTDTIYNHLYSDHNVVFNWFLANTAFKVGENQSLASKLYYLNKAFHSFDCMYDTALPDIFLIFHGSGTMLGKAEYSDFFVALHGCTVGSHKGQYPKFGKGVGLTANSSVIGNCSIGNRVSFGTRTTIFSKDIPADYTVFMDWDSATVKMKATNECYAQQFFITNLKELD